MPRTRIARRPVKEKERFFVQLYLQHGAQPAKIAACEKRACLKKGQGKKVLRRKSVQEEIRSKTAPIFQEQMRQSVIGEAVEAAERAIEEKLKRRITFLKSLKIDKEVLRGRVMQVVLALNMHLHPKELIEAIKTASILDGMAETNNLRLMAAPEPEGENRSVVYASLFDRLRAEKAGQAKTPQPPSEVFDLFPAAPSASVPRTLTEPDEKEAPVKEKPAAKDAKKPERSVVTVEIG